MSRNSVATGDGARTVNPHDSKCVDSWWTKFAQPEQRSDFMSAARIRTSERTRADDAKDGKRNQAIRHVIAPRLFPPSQHEKAKNPKSPWRA